VIAGLYMTVCLAAIFLDLRFFFP